ncbi:hypothetical protein ACYCFK_17845 [Stutzerimonas stutzeri]
MTLEQMASMIAPEAPGCPLATIRDQLRWAQRELCTEGNAWVVRGETVVVAARTPYAEIEAPIGAEAIRILRLLDGQRQLVPGEHYHQTGPNSVAFTRLPSAAALIGDLACRPQFGLDMPSELLSHWAEALMDGARSRLFMLPQPWRDPALADRYGLAFLSAQSDARQLANIGMQAGSVRMQIRRFI